MGFNLMFIIIIYLLIFALILCIVKVSFNTVVINKKGKLKHLKLRRDLSIEEEKGELNAQNILLVDNLNKSLFSRLFKIARKFILLQKCMFSK